MTNVRHLGGEMADWFDTEPAGGPAYGFLLEALRPLVPAGGRVLVAGPHEASVAGALRTYGEINWLVRSQPSLDETGVSVLCGTLAKLPDDEQYDLIVALDGVGRLCSVEGPQLDWAESVQVLSRSLKPGGALLLTVENELGVHRLVDSVTATAAHTDAGWNPIGEYDDSKPGTPDRLRDHFTAEGLTTGWLGTVWPLPSAPTLVIDEPRLKYGPAGALAAVAASVTAAAYATRPVLSDPRRLTASAIRGGIGVELAPAWLVLAFRGPSPAAVSLPAAVLHGGLLPPLPDGRLLEEMLIAACLRHDLPVLRRLLSKLVTVPTTADNVIVDGDRFIALNPSIVVEPPTAVQRFAETLIAGGYDHPWPHAESLTAVLQAAAGLTPDLSLTLPAPTPVREREEHIRRLEEQLADAATRIRYVENELVKRDAELRKARIQIDMFSGKVGYRISKFGMRAARAARRRLRNDS